MYTTAFKLKELPFRHGDPYDLPGDLRRDQNLLGADVGVVGGDVAAAQEVVDGHKQSHGNGANDRGVKAAADGVFTEGRIHRALLGDMHRGAQGILQHLRQLNGFLVVEAAGDLATTARNLAVNERRGVQHFVQDNGQLVSLVAFGGVFAGDIGKNLGALAVELEVDLLRGHKTGFYLDQKHNYGIVGHYARNRRVLDCFTNQGAFALTCAHAGATEVTAVEENSENVSAAKRNAARNQLKVGWIQEDVFQFLRRAEKAGAQYDLIVLDPPSFTRTKSGVRDALRGYRELHMRALKLLSKDGLVATFSCSHHVGASAFLQTIIDALVDARRSARRLRRFEQAPDHPVLLTIPETEYFKGFLLEMMPGR